jgi:hypothetical protein
MSEQNFVSPEPTLGEFRVRARFNPSTLGLVDQLKQKTAELIDLCEKSKQEALANPDKNQKWKGEVARAYSEAQTNYQTAGMYAVNAATA